MEKQKTVGPLGLQAKIMRKIKKYYTTEGKKRPPITQPRLSRIVNGLARPTPEQAAMLERVFAELGFAISKFDMVFAFKPGRHILELDKTRED